MTREWITPEGYVEKKYNYLYKLTLKEDNQHYYYGVHSSNIDPVKDNYYGSGRGLVKYKQRLGAHCFSKEILQRFSTRKEALEAESKLVTKNILQDPLCLNHIVGGGTFDTSGRILTSEEREKVSQRFKGRKRSKESIQKMLETKRQRGTLKISEETKEKLRQAHLGKGHKQSEETKEKIRISHLGSRNGMYGRSPSLETIRKSISTKQKNGTLKHSKETKDKLTHLNRLKASDPVYLKHLSEGLIGKNTWSKGQVRISKNGIRRFVPASDLTKWEVEGWDRGWYN